MVQISNVTFNPIDNPNSPSSFEQLNVPGTMVVLVAEPMQLSGMLSHLDVLTSGQIGKAAKSNEFTGKNGKSVVINAPSGMKADRIVLVGVGKEDDYIEDINSTGGLAAKIESMGGEIAALVMGSNPNSVTFLCDAGMPASLASRYQHLAMGFALRAHSHTFKTDEASAKSANAKCELDVRMVADSSVVDDARFEYANISKALGPVLTVREWVNTPVNLFGTKQFTQAVLEQVDSLGNPNLKATALLEPAITEYEMGGILAVSQASRAVNPPRVVVINYNGAPDQPHSGIALLGKGVVFDTGGHSLKPTDGMLTMQIDKGGACAVWGAMQLLALMDAKVNVSAVLGIVENAMGSQSYQLGSIIRHMSAKKGEPGKTSKIENTDAEGRLVLADISAYAQRELGANTLISAATLTGAQMVALGNATSTGFFAKNSALRDAVLRASALSGEMVWQLPYHSRLNKQLDSPVADMRNVGAGPHGGATLGASYIDRFTLPGNQLVHFDIAGTVAEPEGTGIHNKGGTGAGVRLFAALVNEIARTRGA